MSNLCKRVLGMCAVGMWLTVSAPTQAVTANGPYYATPSWDQKLDGATRFVVLSNWNSEAVLDRETGLVWERTPVSTVYVWNDALFACTSKTVGGRKGWRLPSVHELASLVDPLWMNVSPSLPLPNPFLEVGLYGVTRYWSATTLAANPTNAWYVNFDGGDVFNVSKAFVDPLGIIQFSAWCVRGGMNADQY